MAERRGRAGLRAWWLAPPLALAVAVAACGSSGYTYVKNSTTRTYFKIPSSWKLFRQDEILDSQPGISPQQRARSKQAQWIVAFDAARKPSLTHVLEQSSKEPVGFAQVRALTADEHENYSLAALRNEVIPLEQLSQNDGVDPVSEKELVQGSLRGSRLVNNVRAATGSFVTFDQTALLDKRTRLIYLLVVTCDADCYVKNQKTINSVVDSWTVKER
jgi:hypothetical protein